MNLRDFQRPGETTWELPPWNHPLGAGIYPLCIRKNRHLLPIGTAFAVSRFGIVVTAAHCVLAANQFHRDGRRAPHNTPDGGTYHFDDVGLSVIHHYRLTDGTTRVTIWPIVTFQVARPSDTIFGFLDWHPDVPKLSLAMRPAAPRIGSTVYSVGYCAFQHPPEGISLDAIERGEFNWTADYKHSLRVTEGHVEAIFTQKFAAGFGDAPCFLVDRALEPGQSGGPTFDESGRICGVNSATVSNFLKRDACLISAIYPCLASPIKMTASFGEKFSFSSTEPLVSLMQRGIIRTDGSECLAKIEPVGEKFRVDPLIHRSDYHRVFDDFHGYQENRPASIDGTQVDALGD